MRLIGGDTAARGSRRFWLRALLVVLALRAVISILVWHSGFRAVSDDDFARVVIAQRFAAAPTLDPSGTSWLPLPFWLQGLPMLLLGPSLDGARATAWVAGFVGAAMLLLAASWLAQSQYGALLGACAACCVPYGAWLGAATIPDFVTAALLVVAMASLARPELGRRWIGAAALFAATLSRYEAWPVAVAWAAATMAEPWMGRLLRAASEARARAWARLVAPAGLSLAGPVLWMVHGVVDHTSAWFFVKRVTDYQRALGEGPLPLLEALARAPRALLLFEPEVIALSLVALAVAWRCRLGEVWRSYVLPLGHCAVLLGFLVVGDLRGSAPTHHPERALVAVWLLLGLFVGEVTWHVASVRGRGGRPRRGRVGLGGAALAAFGLAGAVRWNLAERESFIDRSDEVRIGRLAQQRATVGRLLIDTPDYGFFAVLAAFGDPGRAEPFDDRDPRRHRVADPFASPERLRQLVHARRARWLVVTRKNAAMAAAVGSEQAATSKFVLFRL